MRYVVITSLLLLFHGSLLVSGNTADLVIFSYNRPLQLYALLESIHRYITGLEEIHVIYRFDTKAYYAAYQTVRRSFPRVKFKAQGKNPSLDFKALTLKATFTSASEYVLFAVDDILVTDRIDIGQCIEALQKTGAYGFYLRLGTNISQGYPDGDFPLPSLLPVACDMYAWHFSQSTGYWDYPNTVDMTLYLKKDIQEALETLSYKAPNSFEAVWATTSSSVMERMGLCYATSKMVNIPLNIVQREGKTPHMNSYDSYMLLRIFNKGYKIRIDDLYKINNRSAHMNFAVRFIQRVD